jgi:hypothetical protein
MLTEKGKDTTNMAEMLGLGLGIDENVVKIDDNPFVEDGVENLEHHVREGCRGVGKAKRNDVEFEVSISTSKCCFMRMWLIDTLLMITRD